VRDGLAFSKFNGYSGALYLPSRIVFASAARIFARVPGQQRCVYVRFIASFYRVWRSSVNCCKARLVGAGSMSQVNRLDTAQIAQNRKKPTE